MIILTPCSAYALQLHHMHAEKFPNEMREGIDPTPPPAGGSTQKYFRNRVISSQIWITITIFLLI